MSCFCLTLSPHAAHVRIFPPFKGSSLNESYRFCEKDVKSQRCITCVSVCDGKIRFSKYKLQGDAYILRTRIGRNNMRHVQQLAISMNDFVDLLTFIPLCKTVPHCVFYTEFCIFLYHASIGMTIVKRHLDSDCAKKSLCHNTFDKSAEELHAEFCAKNPPRTCFSMEAPYYTHAMFTVSSTHSMTLAYDVCCSLARLSGEIQSRSK